FNRLAVFYLQLPAADRQPSLGGRTHEHALVPVVVASVATVQAEVVRALARIMGDDRQVAVSAFHPNGRTARPRIHRSHAQLDECVELVREALLNVCAAAPAGVVIGVLDRRAAALEVGLDPLLRT